MKAKKFIAKHPICCFCGGGEKAVTVEHLPARIIFPKKHRPKGYEFPACAICNDQTSGDDVLLAVVARATGSMRSTDQHDQALEKAIGGFKTKFPGLKFPGRQELMSVNGVLRRVGIIDVKQPQVDESLCRLAAKLALATMYVETNSIADPSYRINTFWTHNQHDGSHEIARILQMFPNTRSLRQGAWDTSGTFFIRHVAKDDSVLVAAVFYESILLYAQLGPSDEARTWTPLQKTWAPVPKQGIQQVPLS